jgi:cytoskeletal protein CcmA (bactofilin family)
MFLMAAIAVLAFAPAAAAQEDGEHDDLHDALVILTGDVRVDEDQSFHDVVVFHGDMQMDGEVHESLVVFHGDLVVTGHVAGDVVAFESHVTIASGATVDGDVATWREPTIVEGATIGGEVRRATKDFFRPIEVFAARVALWVASTVSLLLLGLLLIGLAPQPMDAVARTWMTSKGKAALWGVILLFGLPIGAVLVMLTIVGIPFGLGTLFSLFFVYSAAYVTASWALGRTIVKEPSSRYLSFLAGFGILRLVGLIPILGGIVSFLATIFGIGLLAVTIWRSRKVSKPAPAAT